ncbi:MAG: HEPN domain-containing protein [Candidatus Cloacimonetes bacterium]|nr:HEPN domain-containing protein [Candidatus Cloacimonadota bacterium]
MTKIKLVENWIERAFSNLQLAKLGVTSEEIYLEDLCFNAQQTVEKSLKALCIYFDISFPKTHNIMFLIEIIKKNGIQVPEEIIEASILNEYAVESRYPGDYFPVEDSDYKEAIEIAEKVLIWVKDKIK